MAGEMMIFADGSSSINNNMTPYQRYAGNNDFNCILEDIYSGKLPCNTGEPFSVLINPDDTTPPWIANSTAYIPPTNKLNIPWYD